MKIWVIGKKGMLGSWFCKILSEKSIEFIATDRNQVDLQNFDQISNFLNTYKPTHIINCAAYTNVEKAEEDKQKAFNANCHGVKNLAQASKKVKLIHFSTDYVFGGEKLKPYKEDDPVNPINVYGQSKLDGESELFKNHDRALCLRISWLFGAKNDFVSKMRSLFQSKEKLSIVSDQVGCPTYAKEVVLTTLDLIDEKGLFHFSSSGFCSWYEFAKFILESEKKPTLCKSIEPILTKNFPTKAKRPLYSVLDLSKIRKTGIKPRPWQSGVEEFING